MVTFLVVRHGYSVSNKDNRYAGQLDIALDEIGLVQAQDVKDFIVKNYKVDAVYSSDLSRAIDTAKPTAEALGLEIKTDKRLRELNVGLWHGLLVSEVKEKYPETFAGYRANKARPEGGETFGEMADRVYASFEQMAEENEGKTLLVATHGGTIRALRCRIEKVAFEDAEQIGNVPNGSITTVVYENGTFKLGTIGENGHIKNKVTEKPVSSVL